MQIQVLGCHGSDLRIGGTVESVRRESCGFLIDGSTLLDAGTIGTRLSLLDQRRIRVVLLSHLHFDHMKGLPMLADNLAEEFDEPVIVAAAATVIQGLKEHIFNDKVYPNFFELPNRTRPVLQARTLHPGKPTILNDLEVIPVAVNHTVPTVGYVVKDAHAALLYSGDTHETEEIWRVARAEPNLHAALWQGRGVGRQRFVAVGRRRMALCDGAHIRGLLGKWQLFLRRPMKAQQQLGDRKRSVPRNRGCRPRDPAFQKYCELSTCATIASC